MEGHNSGNDWWDWEHRPGKIHDGTTSGTAADWWKGRAEDDLRHAAALGQNAHRLSLEWSRLEPEPGRWNEAAFARYSDILRCAREVGLEPLVTLHHFTLPRWLARRGSWLAADAAERFERYALECARRLGSLVDFWATQNEPNVLTYAAYADGRWPPGQRNPLSAMRALRTMLDAHARAYRALHAEQAKARVGIVLSLPVFDPFESRPLDRAAAHAQGWAFNGVLLEALASGRFLPPLGVGHSIPELARSFDWLGVNYYGRYRVAFDLRAARELFGRRDASATVHTATNDWGEPYPEGLTRQLLALRRFGVPLYVTENGIFDNHDQRRSQFLLEHVAAVRAAIDAGADVRGYFHWTLLDNFEWAEGWATRFGLFALDPRTQQRTLRPSGELYAELCRSHGAASSS